MNIKPLHPNFKLPTRSTELAGGYDIYMPEAGTLAARNDFGILFPLGFAASVPKGHVALLLPRSSSGCNKGLSLNNTVGVIDADYNKEWLANLRVHNIDQVSWAAGDRILQFLIVPVTTPELVLVDELESFSRTGGLGSTGK